MEQHELKPFETRFENPSNSKVVKTLSLMAGKWRMVVFWTILNGFNRFGLISKAVPDISKRMLTKELRELEMDGLISRKVYSQMPPKVEYSLTEKGRSFLPIIKEIENWGNANF